MDGMEHLIGSAVTGLITGAFSAGAVWGVLKTEIRWMRRDIDEVRRKVLSLGSGSTQ